MWGHKLVVIAQGHDQEQGVPSLLSYHSVSVDEGNKEGKEQEVSSSLVLTGVEEQLKDGGITGHDAAQLMEEKNELMLHQGGIRNTCCWDRKKTKKNIVGIIRLLWKNAFPFPLYLIPL